MAKIKQGRYSDYTVKHIKKHCFKEYIEYMLQVMSLRQNLTKFQRGKIPTKDLKARKCSHC